MAVNVLTIVPAPQLFVVLVTTSVSVGVPQLSVAVALPNTVKSEVSVSQSTVTFGGHVKLGIMLSSTVTVAVHSAVVPLSALTVKVTILFPIFEQSNELGFTANPTIDVHPAELPLSI